jgi:hypothetical protein
MRLIACDLDGTLFDPVGQISHRTVAALNAAHDAGVTVVIATGRPPALATHVIERLGRCVTHGVMANGSVISTFPDMRPLRMTQFEIDRALRTVCRLREADPRFGFALATDAGFAHEPGFAERMPAASPGPSVPDALAVAEGATFVIKLMVFHPVHTSHELLDIVPPLIGDELAVSHMGADAVELGPVGVDKGSGLAWLCGHLGIDAADVVAFGDEYNDHEMLQWAGLGVAMGNAPDATKACADEVTLTNAEDGVAVVVERLLAARSAR